MTIAPAWLTDVAERTTWPFLAGHPKTERRQADTDVHAASAL